MLNILFFFAAILLLIYVKLKYFKSRLESMLLNVPGPDYNVFVGNLMRFRGGREEVYRTLCSICDEFRDSPIVRIWLGKNVRLYLTKAESAEVIASDSSHNIKGYAYRWTSPWFRDGLILSTGNKWFQRRRMLTPSFHFQILEQFRVIMNEHTVTLTKLLGENKDNYCDVYPYATRASLDIICETAMGVKLGCQGEKSHYYLAAVSGITECVAKRLYSVFLQNDFLYQYSETGQRQKEILKVLHNFTTKVIKERKAQYKERKSAGTEEAENEFGQKRRLAFMDMLLECQDKDNSIDDFGIQEEVDMFMFAGHDTTSSGISWTLYNIARFPEIQQKIHDELDIVLGSEPVDDISSESLKDLRYLECVIKESLRLFPPVPFFSRMLQKDTVICGYTVPASTNVTFLVQQIHTDPKHWPDPHTFDPDRFLPHNAAHRHPYAFIPFSAGSRNCIGQRFAMMELKTVMAHVLHRYTLKTETKLETVKKLGEFVLRPSGGLWLQFKSRATN
ncbi:Cytochrome P450 4V2 [Chamberlinius hualienensis]|uniref:Cytochrome P450 4GM1 n=1 Tax=Chamberlinius hualienensis TaxID=1551368 RepID=A0A1J1E3M9_9MYRI|nr:cytochrome P450 4GM1 [Chamberlinius hualienensis]